MHDLLAQQRTYPEIAAELGIRPGLAYLLATGLPADGSAAIAPDDRMRPGFQSGSTQLLTNPPGSSPLVKPDILAWVSERAAHDLSPAATTKEA